VVLLQIVAVHWPPAQGIFGTTALGLREWGIAAGTASTILLLEEGRKLAARMTGAGKHQAAPAAAP
jgi:Ca2+-transporting ATPase